MHSRLRKLTRFLGRTLRMPNAKPNAARTAPDRGESASAPVEAAREPVLPTRHVGMTLPIEDYGIIGDLHTSALVGRDGSIDWLCLPRFDSSACFAKLLGDEDHGSWKLAPKGSHGATHRHYRGDTLVLESEFVTDEGTVRVVDCMPIRQQHPEVVRLVEGVRGKVTMEMVLTIRFGYGQIIPWVRRIGRDPQCHRRTRRALAVDTRWRSKGPGPSRRWPSSPFPRASRSPSR
jgi:hypothetical protein